MGRRIITTENLEEDIKIEGELRPLSLKEYIGQKMMCFLSMRFTA